MNKLMQQYLSFVLDDNEFAINILRIQEIRGYEKTKAIPNAPHYVIGVVNLRGAVIPIIDLRLRFGMNSIDYTATTVVIVVHVKMRNRYRKIGLIVDAVNEVYDVRDEEIQDCSEVVSDIENKYVRGIATIEEQMVTIIDLDQTFDFEEIQKSVA